MAKIEDDSPKFENLELSGGEAADEEVVADQPAGEPEVVAVLTPICWPDCRRSKKRRRPNRPSPNRSRRKSRFEKRLGKNRTVRRVSSPWPSPSVCR